MFRFCYRGHCDWLEWLPAPPPLKKKKKRKVFKFTSSKNKTKQTSSSGGALALYNALECHYLERFLFFGSV